MSRKRVRESVDEEQQFPFTKQNWYRNLEDGEKEFYIERYLKLYYSVPFLPTVQDVLDLENQDPIEIKRLLLDVDELSYLDRMSPHFDSLYEKIQKKFRQLQQKKIEENETKQQIYASEYSEEIKVIIGKRYENAILSGEEGKIRSWLNIVLSIPQNPKEEKEKNLSLLLQQIQEKLEKRIYGMKSVKEELLCIICNTLTQKKSKNKAIGLCGPPGVGKTMFAQILSEVLNLPLQFISLGGSNDSSELLGHNYTYSKSEPGKIVKSLIEMKCNNGILFFDELDKLTDTEKGNEVQAALLHISDFTENHNFHDKYMPEIPIDLSNLIFIYSFNDESRISPVLLNRIPTIHIPGYTIEEKIEIFSSFLLPEICNNYSLSPEQILFPKEVIYSLVKKCDKEKSGVRKIKHTLNRIIQRIHMHSLLEEEGVKLSNLSYSIENFSFPFTVPQSLVDQVFKQTEIQDSYRHSSLYT